MMLDAATRPVTLHAVALSAPLAVFTWQVLGAARTFRPATGGNSWLAEWISLAFAALIYDAWRVPLKWWLVGAAWVGLLGALVLFEWARRTVAGQYFSYIFSADTPTFLCTAGPFAYIRNPFYSSYLLAMTSTALMLPSVFRGLVVLATVVYFSAAAVHEERKFARSPLARDYETYKRRTGRFIPRLGSRASR